MVFFVLLVRMGVIFVVIVFRWFYDCEDHHEDNEDDLGSEFDFEEILNAVVAC